MLLNDRMITALSTGACSLLYDGEIGLHPLIEPFIDHQVSEIDGKRIMSYGLGSYTYDVRLGTEIGIPKYRIDQPYFDPKRFDRQNDYDWYTTTEPFYLPANGYCLARTVETIHVPRSVLVECIGKSTYARAAVIQLVTPLEPGWYGKPTLEIVNNHGKPVVLYPEEGICALKFNWQGPNSYYHCGVSYADRNGKYQGDVEVEGPKI